ncbi:L-rhamnose mutarotase [Rhodocytophaga rosea]|uniref:L-rhamnose mutarotase n=1 Tax=Rhodocytophaga rosea TaxID=2704465 RepID=A0A6C0GMM4_9BACT|nr:L-rhamnose mutarotase [Rhodocytophaga rosea]QHT69187.1 L-rhamnose mutarotase [Rhodocytophaga rosea]
MKQFAKTILLKNDPNLIATYLHYHNHIWLEVVQSFRKVGVEDIRIWMIGRRLFMLMTTTDAFDPNTDFDKYLSLHPKNEEWEELMKTFQEKAPEAKPDEHWADMELIFQMPH